MRVVGIWKSKKGKALFVVVTRRGQARIGGKIKFLVPVR